MKNLKALYENLLEDKKLTFEEYLEHVGPVIPSQGMFKLESCEDDTGFVLRSYDGSFHVWFVGRVFEEPGSVERYQVTETSTWAPHQLGQALESLANQMHIDCETLIENNGEKA